MHCCPDSRTFVLSSVARTAGAVHETRAAATRAATPASTRLLGAAVAAYLGGSIALAALGYDTMPSARLIAANLAGLFAIFAGLSCFGAGLLLARRTARGDTATLASLVDGAAARRAAHACLAIALFAILNATFWRYKNIIPDIVPFSWDPALYRLDRALHGGDPWALLQPVLGHPRVTSLLGMVYGPGWVLVWMATLTWIAWSANESMRRRYMLAYVAMWVLLGNVLATLLSSAGPAFYHEVAAGAVDPFAGMRAYLAGALPFVVAAQDAMWQANGLSPHPVLVPPISAAPSLHIALAALNALAIGRVDRRLGAAAWAFAGLVFLATIHLGLHYAVDAYIAVAGVIAIWWAAARIPMPDRKRHGAG